MKVLLKKASDWNFYKNIEINSLEELFRIYPSLIIESDIQTCEIYKNSDNSNYSNDFEVVITIYDDYVE